MREARSRGRGQGDRAGVPRGPSSANGAGTDELRGARWAPRSSSGASDERPRKRARREERMTKPNRGRDQGSLSFVNPGDRNSPICYLGNSQNLPEGWAIFLTSLGRFGRPLSAPRSASVDDGRSRGRSRGRLDELRGTRWAPRGRPMGPMFKNHGREGGEPRATDNRPRPYDDSLRSSRHRKSA